MRNTALMVPVFMMVLLAAAGCSDMIADQEFGSAQEWLTDRVTNLAALPDTDRVELTWTDPAVAEFDRVEITWSPGGAAPQIVAAGTQTFTAAGLSNCQSYEFTVRSVMKDGTYRDATISVSCGIPVGTAAELNDMWNNLTACYALTKDIDLAGYSASDGKGWDPVGTHASPFTGSLDGNGHSISGLAINRKASNLQGLFGRIGAGGAVKNLDLKNANITGNYSAGIIVASNDGTVSQCGTTGIVNGDSGLGGIVGYNSGIIEHCQSAATVTGNNWDCGGIAGINSIGTISYCYATGNISAQEDVGGLVGHVTSGTISNSYATGPVSGTTCVGGLVGYVTSGTISNSYATGPVSGTTYVGGLVGDPITVSIDSCYFYQGPDNGLGTLKSSAEMKDKGTYAGWDFTTVWGINGFINGGYPHLLDMP